VICGGGMNVREFLNPVTLAGDGCGLLLLLSRECLTVSRRDPSTMPPSAVARSAAVSMCFLHGRGELIEQLVQREERLAA